MLNWRMRLAWGGPKDYVLRRWLLDWGWYGFTGYIRVIGLLIQIYDKRSLAGDGHGRQQRQSDPDPSQEDGPERIC